MNGLVISGISTGIGKTLVSSVFAQATDAWYWKPVQAGTEPLTDTERVQQLGVLSSKTMQEVYRLKNAVSPHAAAKMEKKKIKLARITDIALPGFTVIEGAGGLMTPLTDTETFLDLFKAMGHPLVFVIRHYLGSINHSLLALSAMAAAGLDLRFIAISGSEDPESEKVIRIFAAKHWSNLCYLHFPEVEAWQAEHTALYATQYRDTIRGAL